MHRDDALNQVLEIRRRLAAAGRYRGFRSTAVGFSGLLAIAAATVQALWLADAKAQFGAFLALWTTVAALSTAVVGAVMIVRVHRLGSRMERDLAVGAAEAVAPGVVLGAWLTIALLYAAPDEAWMLPGLWALLFSLSVFATRRILTPAVAWVGAHYAFTGLACLIWGQGDQALAPWTMGLTFGVGQLLAALVLLVSVEQNDDAA